MSMLEDVLIKKNSSYKVIAPRNTDGTLKHDDNTTFFAMYQGSGPDQTTHVNRNAASYNENNNDIWVYSPPASRQQAYIGENNIPSQLNIPPERTIYGAYSYGGKWMPHDFATSIKQNPEVKNRKCVLFEPVPGDLNKNEVQTIADNDAMVFVFNGGSTNGRGNFANNFLYSGKKEIAAQNKEIFANSNSRIFNIDMNFKTHEHSNSFDAGSSAELGFMDLLKGDGTKFKENVDKLMNGEKLYYIDPLNTNHKYEYNPKFELYFKGKKIEFNTAEEFYNYYVAVDNYYKEENTYTKLNYLDIMYQKESITWVTDKSLSNVPTILNDYMAQFNSFIEKLEITNSPNISNNAIGLESIINETVAMYNNSIDNLKTTMTECTKLGTRISNLYVKAEKDLNNSTDNL